MVLLGKAIAAYREKNGISLRQLARLIGVDHTLLYNFEQGRVIESDSLAKILLLLFCEAPSHNNQQPTTKVCQENSKRSKSAVPVSPLS